MSREDEIERALRDLNMTIWILTCNMPLFGHEIRFFVVATKVLITISLLLLLQ